MLGFRCISAIPNLVASRDQFDFSTGFSGVYTVCVGSFYLALVRAHTHTAVSIVTKIKTVRTGLQGRENPCNVGGEVHVLIGEPCGLCCPVPNMLRTGSWGP